uniref:uncharacterized protein LOC105352585 n=1 Tax=Fragaria vesca subsp. vesca TaxID=101020 RepID=UPI0005CA44E4|nr:PREDICTED: uncharacterized protein LOC105352585 [Fragaria vesca subsp. vesca]
MVQSPKFWVDSAAISKLNVTGSSEITATWYLTLWALNPNQILGIDYDNVEAILFYGDKGKSHKNMLAWKRVSHPFYLSTRDLTTLEFELSTEKAYVGEDVVKEILAGESSARFGLSLLVWYRHDIDVYDLNQINFMRIFCDPIEFAVYPNVRMGKLTAHPMACKEDFSPEHIKYWLLLK